MEENNENEIEEEKNFGKEDDIKTNNYEISYMPTRKVSKNLKPFLFGILGGCTSILVAGGILFSIPSVRNIFNNNQAQTIQTSPLQSVNVKEYDNPVVAIADTVGTSIVGIKVEFNYSSFFGTQKASQEGSGIIIKSDGYILTNNHVIDVESYAKDAVINVYLPNSDEPLPATVIGSDEQTDIAVIKVECTDLPAVTLGNSSDLKVGEMVVAIGNPLGMDFAGSVTVGYVSALNRKLNDSSGNEYNLIQTDAAINTGNSGGALVNTKGEVIGINTVKIKGTGVEGLSFAIPIDDVKDIINQLNEYGQVKRPYIGIGGIAVNEETAKKYDLVEGVYVKEVYLFSAAEKAGIKVGDVITKVNGQTVKTVKEMNEIKEKFNVGDKLDITVNREGKEMNLTLTLQENSGSSIDND